MKTENELLSELENACGCIIDAAISVHHTDTVEPWKRVMDACDNLLRITAENDSISKDLASKLFQCHAGIRDVIDSEELNQLNLHEFELKIGEIFEPNRT